MLASQAPRWLVQPAVRPHNFTGLFKENTPFDLFLVDFRVVVRRCEEDAFLDPLSQRLLAPGQFLARFQRVNDLLSVSLCLASCHFTTPLRYLRQYIRVGL